MARSQQDMKAFFDQARRQIRSMGSVDAIVAEEQKEQNAKMTVGNDSGGIIMKCFHVDVSLAFEQQLDIAEDASVKMKAQMEKNTDLQRMIIDDMENTDDGMGPKMLGAKGGMSELPHPTQPSETASLRMGLPAKFPSESD